MTHREPAGEGAGGDVSGVDGRGTISPLSAGAGGAGAGHAEYQVRRAPDEQAQARPRGDVHGEVRGRKELRHVAREVARAPRRRDAAIIAVFTATGIRLSEMAGIRYHPGDPARNDLDLQAREIRIRGKGGTARTVRIGHQAARSLDRYLRARARHAQAHRPQLWLGVNNRGPLTATGIYQIVARRGRQCGVNAYPHRFRHHFSHTWLDRGGAERDLMELNGWTSPQMLTRYGASARGARARRSYDRIMDGT